MTKLDRAITADSLDEYRVLLAGRESGRANGIDVAKVFALRYMALLTCDEVLSLMWTAEADRLADKITAPWRVEETESEEWEE